jgi:hypothetical protein
MARKELQVHLVEQAHKDQRVHPDHHRVGAAQLR